MTATKTITYNPKTIVHTLFSLMMVLFGLYMYFVSTAVVHVVVRTEVEQNTQKLQSEINILETDYIAAQHRVSEQISMLEGYNEVTAKTFIDRQAPSLVLGNTR